MHHIRQLKDIKPGKNILDKLMIRHRRKQISYAENATWKFTRAKYSEESFQVDGEPYDGKLSRTVRERAHS
jgi:hypothetical protein